MGRTSERKVVNYQAQCGAFAWLCKEFWSVGTRSFSSYWNMKRIGGLKQYVCNYGIPCFSPPRTHGAAARMGMRPVFSAGGRDVHRKDVLVRRLASRIRRYHGASPITGM